MSLAQLTISSTNIFMFVLLSIATQLRWQRQWQRWPSQQLTQGRVASSCASNVQCCGRGNASPPSFGHKGVCIAQLCAVEVPLQRVFAPFQGGGILRAHLGFGFILFYFINYLFSLLNNPLFLHSKSVPQDSRQPIDGLPWLLLYFLSS